MARKLAKKTCAMLLAASILASTMVTSVSANYTMATPVEQLPEKAPWADNYIAPEGVDFSSNTVSDMLQAIENFDFEKFAQDNSDLPWLDELLVNEGVIPDNDANLLFSRGSALYMRTHTPGRLGFVGTVAYADTLKQNSIFTVALSNGTPAEDTKLRKNYPSHENQTFHNGSLSVNQKKFITYGNTAVTLYEFTNNSASDITFTMTVKSPFTSKAVGDELVGYKVAAPLMDAGGSGLKTVQAMSYVDVHLSGKDMTPAGNTLTREITVPAGATIDQKVVMGWLADEIPQSAEQYEQFKNYETNDEAFAAQVKMYNEWWAENIPYIDIPDENVKKVIYYRWWCNRFNFLEANIPGNDWQFPMNMEGVNGYNNGITVSVPWVMQDLKWIRDPSYVYGTWMAQGEYSGDDNYKNNPGRPGTWTWDMMQNTSQVGWEAYKIHGGGEEVLQKFADYSKYDVLGTLNRFGGKGDLANLICYNHGPITGNDGDCIGMHWNATSTVNNYARIDGTATTYANAVAAAKMYAALGDTENQQLMEQKANDIRTAMLDKMWYDGTDFEAAYGKGDGIADTNGEGSFLHIKVANGDLVPWRDNNLFAYSFGVAPTALEAEQYPDYAKYATTLKDYADPTYYPIFPFYTADQNSVMKRVASLAWDSDKTCCDHFAWCNFGNYINVVRSALRYYPVENIDTEVYKTLFDWGAWLNCIVEGDTSYMDSAEFFWTSGFEMDGNVNSTPTGNIIRSWIHHDTLGMMDYTVIEDMAGLQPREDNKIELWPVGINYDYFVVDNIRYHDQDLTIVWQDPAKAAHYEGIPTGFSLYVGKERVFTTNEMSHVIYNPETGKVELPTGDVEGAVGDNSKTQILFEKGSATPVATANDTSLADNARAVDIFNKAGIDLEHHNENLALNATVSSSYIAPDSSIDKVKDGSTVTAGSVTITDAKKTQHTALFKGTPNAADSIEFDFGEAKDVDNVKIYFYNNRLINGYGTPQSYNLEYWDGQNWQPLLGQVRNPSKITSNYNNVEFTKVNTQKLRITVVHDTVYSTGIKEIQIFNNGVDTSTVPNEAPIVSVQDNISAEQGELLTITPTVDDSTLPGGQFTYKWEMISGPEGAEPEVIDHSDTAAIYKAKFSVVGDYMYRLTVSDGELNTSIEFAVSVFVPTAGLRDLMKPFEDITSDISGKLKRNGADFTETSWKALQDAITNAKNLLASDGYSKEQVDDATIRLQVAIDGLEYVNVGLLAKPTANFTAGWERLAAVNDGYIPTRSSGQESNVETGEKLEWGNWGNGATSQWVVYSWDEPVNINGSSVFFYDDGGGTLVPKTYTLAYYAPENENADSKGFVDVATYDLSTDEARRGALNKFVDASFDQVTTTKFRITLENRSEGGYNGIKEWRVLGSLIGGGEEDKEIASIAASAVDTYVNEMPTLPETVLVTYTDNTKGYKQVTWEEIDPQKLTVATSFEVLGHVEGTTISASCIVNVKYDKRPLKTLIEAAQKIWEEKAYYAATADTWSALEVALTQANDTYNSAAATQGDITTAEDGLKAVLKDEYYYDKRPLKSLIDKAQGIWNDKDSYAASEITWNALKAALDDGNAAYTNAEASKETVIACEKSLTAALARKFAITKPYEKAIPSASYTPSWNSVAGLNDGVCGKTSGEDLGMQMWGSWGTPSDPWVQYSWDAPVTLSSMEVFYFDNRATDSSYDGQSLEEWGGVAIPISQELFYLDENGEWVEITADMMEDGGLATELDKFNVTTFKQPITTTALKLQTHRNGLATGIMEWVVNPADAKFIDRTDLETALAAYADLTEANYKPSTWSGLKAAVDAANALAEDADQTAIDAAVIAINNAMDALEKIAVRDQMEIALAAAKAVTEEELNGAIASSVKLFNAAWEKAIEVNKNMDASQKEVDDAAFALIQAINSLLPAGDKTELQALVTEANVVKENLAKYQEEGKAEFIAALEEAERVLASGDEIDETIKDAVDALKAAMNALKPLEAVDKSRLQHALDDAAKYGDLSQYVDGAEKLAFQGALQHAQEVMENADATQQEVNDAAFALNVAMTKLRKIANKANLQEIIEKAEAIDLSQYTEESAAAVRAALTAAQAVYNDKTLDENDQAKVNAAEQALKDAINGLVKKSDGGSTSKPDSSKPSGSQTGDSTNVLPIAFLAMAALGCVAVLFKKKREQN